MRGTILFVRSAGKHSREALIYARELGYSVAVAQAGYDRSLGLADYVLDVDTENIDELLTTVVAFARTHPLSGVISFREFTAEQVALIADVLGLPGTRPGAVMSCRNKFVTRSLLETAGVRVPGFVLVDDIGDLERAARGLKYPIVVKPPKMAGSLAVLRIDTPEDIPRMTERLIKAKQDAPIQDHMTDKLERFWIAEEYLEGFEVSVESVTLDGVTTVLAIHDKMIPMEGPVFCEDFFVTPSPRIDTKLEARIIAATIRAHEALGFDHGISHAEFRVSDTITLLEMNPRLGGTPIELTVRHSTGVDLLQVGVRLALGLQVDLSVGARRAAAFTVLRAPEGQITAVSGFDFVNKMQGVLLAQQWLDVGDVVIATEADDGGVAVFEGSTPTEAYQRAARAHEAVVFETDPP